jgi:pimeloyl-ACP methyl ester carboxylesterase
MPVVERGGARVSYSRVGTGPAVLLVQGVGVIGNGWAPQVAALRDHFTVVTFDNRGLGASSLGAASLSIEALADDAVAIMDAEGLGRFHLAGHSMGGVIAQQIALTAPGRLQSLSLLCTFSRGEEATRLTWAMLAAGVRTRLGTKRMRRRAFVRLVMPPATGPGGDLDATAATLAGLFGRDLADQPPIVMQQLRALRRFDASARLAQLAGIPTLVVIARHDIIARPEYGRRLAAAIPHARLVEIADGGHGVTIQRAAAINKLLVEHFDAAR